MDDKINVYTHSIHPLSSYIKHVGDQGYNNQKLPNITLIGWIFDGDSK
jgi:hypothetical protein